MPRLIALAMPNGPMFVEMLQRVWADGDAVLPVDLRLPEPIIKALLRSMGAAAVIDHVGDRVSLADTRTADTRTADSWQTDRQDTYSQDTEPGDALVMTTSGTTGTPKGVVLTHEAIRASAAMTSRRLGVTDADHWLACLPVAHIGGLAVITRALLTNTKLTALNGFDARAVEDAARIGGATLVSMVTTTMQRIDTSLFRAVVLGAGNVPTELPANVHITYGMTETGSGIVYDHYALDGVQLSIDEHGQLLVKSPTMLRCYRDGTDPKTPDGWLPTGDAGSITDGRLVIYGRMDDMINTGGEKVWPVAVEQAIRHHPAIADALVFGEPDDQWGQRVVALAELHSDVAAPSLSDVRAIVKQYLPAYCAPKILRFAETLPRTISGKVIRRGANAP